MTQATLPPFTSAPSGMVVRVALALVLAVVLLATFAAGRATAPGDDVRTVTVPVSDDAAPAALVCPPSRPPVC